MSEKDIIKKEEASTVVIKYGGNAMTDENLKKTILRNIAELQKSGIKVVLVHGGGPVIKNLLSEAGVDTEFMDGQRVTDANTMRYVEMALSASVNGELVRHLLNQGVKSIGLSGKDAGLAKAVKRYHTVMNDDGSVTDKDIGYVGDIVETDTHILSVLLNEGYLPVISPVSLGRDDGMDYNVNADVFAGHIAGSLQADAYVVMTDVDGLMRDINDPESIVRRITADELKKEKDIIKGGMIPKVESCLNALKQGAKKALIINGTKEGMLNEAFLESKPIGTQIFS